MSKKVILTSNPIRFPDHCFLNRLIVFDTLLLTNRFAGQVSVESAQNLCNACQSLIKCILTQRKVIIALGFCGERFNDLYYPLQHHGVCLLQIAQLPKRLVPNKLCLFSFLNAYFYTAHGLCKNMNGIECKTCSLLAQHPMNGE